MTKHTCEVSGVIFETRDRENVKSPITGAAEMSNEKINFDVKNHFDKYRMAISFIKTINNPVRLYDSEREHAINLLKELGEV